MSTALTITWPLSSLSGYGIYGLQIAQQFFRRGGRELILTQAPQNLTLPDNAAESLKAAIVLGQRLGDHMQSHPEETLAFNHATLFAVGNDGRGFAGQDRIWGNPAIGCAAIEQAHFTAHGRDVMQRYQRLIAISRWNAAILADLQLAPVSLCYQGIDTKLFYPRPRAARWQDRFVIFSGGKFEFRKAQDLVVAAFRSFQKKYPDALLVTCWQTPYVADPTLFAAAGHCRDVPQPDNQGGLRLVEWLRQQGLPDSSFLALPYTPNPMMPEILAATDAAIFPNRCEGGTNLVAMEAMACGVPTLVANNTGQKDLIELFGCDGLAQQRPVISTTQPVTDWGESDLDEIIAWLESTYQSSTAARQKAQQIAKKLADFDWSVVNERLLQVCFAEASVKGAANFAV